MRLASFLAPTLIGALLAGVAAGQTSYRVNCGGGDYTDPQGNSWGTDTGFNTGEIAGPVQNLRYTQSVVGALAPVGASGGSDRVRPNTSTEIWPAFRKSCTAFSCTSSLFT